MWLLCFRLVLLVGLSTFHTSFFLYCEIAWVKKVVSSELPCVCLCVLANLKRPLLDLTVVWIICCILHSPSHIPYHCMLQYSLLKNQILHGLFFFWWKISVSLPSLSQCMSWIILPGKPMVSCVLCVCLVWKYAQLESHSQGNALMTEQS